VFASEVNIMRKEGIKPKGESHSLHKDTPCRRSFLDSSHPSSPSPQPCLDC
jgi:hypothetical protein